jgi:hypothetical protein
MLSGEPDRRNITDDAGGATRPKKNARQFAGRFFANRDFIPLQSVSARRRLSPPSPRNI